jgi:carotenoid cleavage dioxygenase
MTEREPYLQGNFAPVEGPYDAADLRVIGHVPEALDGLYVRNGANPVFPPIGRHHWFDGDGMLHGVVLQAGRARYLRRFVETAGLLRERAAGRALWKGFIESPLDNPDRTYKNAANTSVVWHHGKLLALFETASPHAVSVPDLATIGLYDFHGEHTEPFTAHPKLDPVTGELVGFGYRVHPPPYLTYVVISPDGHVAHRTPIELPVCAMMHDFAITERYALFLDLPFTASLARARRGEPLAAWEPDRPGRIGVLGRRAEGSSIRWFEIAPCYIFHVLNAWEEGDRIELYAARMDRMSIGTMGRETGTNKGNTGASLHRYTIDLAAGTVREEAIDDRTIEFPKVADARVGRPARFGYAARHIRGEHVLTLDTVLRYDLAGGTSRAHTLGGRLRCGEFVHVPRPGAEAEDDGWLLGFVHDEDAGTSELRILDARDIEAEPVARVILPVRVPYGFHGTWVPRAWA